MDKIRSALKTPHTALLRSVIPGPSVQFWAFLPLCTTPKITVGGRSNARIAGGKWLDVCRVTFDDVGLHNLFHARHGRRAGGWQKMQVQAAQGVSPSGARVVADGPWERRF